MSVEETFNAINEEFLKVRKEHAEMKGSFTAVNAQHDEMIHAFEKVEKQHDTMNNELAEIKSLLKQILMVT